MTRIKTALTIRLACELLNSRMIKNIRSRMVRQNYALFDETYFEFHATVDDWMINEVDNLEGLMNKGIS